MAEVRGLSEFIADLGKLRWQWGTTDCLMILADWIKARRGFDPAAKYRGTYSDEAGSRAILIQAGGLTRLVANTLREHGVKTTSTPLPGDIAVVRLPCRAPWFGGIVMRPAGAIVVNHEMFAVMTQDRGVVISGKPRLVAAWRI
jgi:hypothetical protein